MVGCKKRLDASGAGLSGEGSSSTISSSGSKTYASSTKLTSLLRFTVSMEMGRCRLDPRYGASNCSSRSESGSTCEFSSALISES